MRDSDYIVLPSHCIICVGYTRAALFDFDQKRQCFISHDWVKILNAPKPLKLLQVYQKMAPATRGECQSFIQYLYDQNMVLLAEKPDFQNPDLSDYPKKDFSELTRISVAFNTRQPLLTPDVLGPIPSVQELTLYISDRVNIPRILFAYFEIPLNTVEIVIDYPYTSLESLETLIDTFSRIKQVTVLKAPIAQKIGYQQSTIQYLTSRQMEADFRHEPDYNLFLESQNINLYYHGRVYISADGSVKNTPYTKTIFGNIHQTPLQKIVAQKDFQKLWFATKDKIDVCRDCEFRAICIDKRPLENRRNEAWFSKTECAYNPYICLNSNDEGYLNLSECGVHSQRDGFRIEVNQFILMKDLFWRQNRKDR